MTEFWPAGSVELTLKDATTGREACVDSREVFIKIDYSAPGEPTKITIEADFLGAFRAPATPLPTMIDGGGLIAGGE